MKYYEKNKELRSLNKQLCANLIEINTLKKQKEKDGILQMNANLVRKTTS